LSILEYLMSSWQSLISNKMRSFLTILGIVIGVGAVVFLVAFGRGQQQQMNSIFENMGANAIYVSPTSRQFLGAGKQVPLTVEDATALTEVNKAPAVASVAPMYTRMLKCLRGNKIYDITVNGATVPIQHILNY